MKNVSQLCPFDESHRSDRYSDAPNRVRWQENQPDYSGNGYGPLSPPQQPARPAPTLKKRPTTGITIDTTNALVGGSLHGPIPPSDTLGNSWLDSSVQLDCDGNIARNDRKTLPSQSDIRSLPSQRRPGPSSNIAQPIPVTRNHPGTGPAAHPRFGSHDSQGQPIVRENSSRRLQRTPAPVSVPTLVLPARVPPAPVRPSRVAPTPGPPSNTTAPASNGLWMERKRYPFNTYEHAVSDRGNHLNADLFMRRVTGELEKIKITGEKPRTVAERYDFTKGDRDAGM
ncbi:MAG: hypothetical protein MMC33_008982 [Icmadophila ericetorum]|nr:hypothetical protein [Icmadophila ericetorum]